MVSRQAIHLVILIVIGMLVGFITSHVSIDGIPLVFFLIQNNALVYQGYIIPLITSMIVVYPNYLGLYDVIFNSISVILIDGLLSVSFTYREYFVIFFATGLFGNLASLLNGPNITSFGASGGIFGLVAAAVTHDYALNRRMNTALVGWFVIIFILNSFSSVYVDWLAHTGGALIGLGLGYVVGQRHRNVYLRNRFMQPF